MGRQVDAETAELALELAEALCGMRGTSRFALRSFLAALQEDDVVAARLELAYTKRDGGRLEAELRVGPEA